MRYLFTVLKHKWFVLVAGLRVGGVGVWRLLLHDLSKLRPSEFAAYRREFSRPSDDLAAARARFETAWKKHQNRNAHHWQYWLLYEMKAPGLAGECRPLPMPEKVVREMVADWLAAGRVYGGAWPVVTMWHWLDSAYPTMLLHETTIARLGVVLDELREKAKAAR